MYIPESIKRGAEVAGKLIFLYFCLFCVGILAAGVAGWNPLAGLATFVIGFAGVIGIGDAIA